MLIILRMILAYMLVKVILLIKFLPMKEYLHFNFEIINFIALTFVTLIIFFRYEIFYHFFLFMVSKLVSLQIF